MLPELRVVKNHIILPLVDPVRSMNARTTGRGRSGDEDRPRK